MARAQQIPQFNNVPDSMFYTGDKPWHGTGVAAPEPVAAMEARRLARLDFDVGLHQVLVEYPLGAVEMPGYRAVSRLSDQGLPEGKPWAVVSDRFEPCQTSTQAEFLEAMGVRVHTAGAFHGGRRTWFMGQIDGAEIVKGDRVSHNLILVNANDGTLALSVGLTSVRVVCWNTCQHALDDAKAKGKRYTIRHVGDVEKRLEEAAEALGLVTAAAAGVTDLYRGLADTSVTTSMMDEILVQVFDGDSTRTKNVRAQVADLYASSPTVQMPGVAGTGWGAFNAVTQYVDHVMGGSKAQGDRLFSAWFGLGEEIKDKALEVIQVVTGRKPAAPAAGPQVIAI